MADLTKHSDDVEPKDTKSVTSTQFAAIGETVVESIAEKLVGNGYLARLIAREVVKNDEVLEHFVSLIDADLLAEKMAEQLINKFSTGYPYAVDILSKIKKEVATRMTDYMVEQMTNDMRAA